MIDTSDFYSGLHLEIDGEYYTVIWFQHHKPGKGGAMMRTKLQNIKTGTIIERTFKSGEKLKDIVLESRKKQYLFNDGKMYTFMDMETFEQFSVPKENLGKLSLFLKENMEIEALYLEGEFLNIELPISVELKVVSTVPGIRGDTVSNVMKPAVLETGIEVKVPLFISEGDTIRVDTRTGEYIERV